MARLGWLLGAGLLLLGSLAFAQKVGDVVFVGGEIEDDLYAAGGEVEIMATALGDVVAAGGRVVIGETVARDVMAAGGSVEISARVGDDLRAAGGAVTLSGQVTDDALIAGGRVRVTPAARIAGRAWLSGGNVEVRGPVGRELRVSAGEVLIDAEIAGDVEVIAGELKIGPRAVILGRLTYRSPQEAEVAAGARLLGEVEQQPWEHDLRPSAAGIVAGALIAVVGLLVPMLVVQLAYPGFGQRNAQTLRAEPLKSLGLGLAVVAATPLVISLLFATVIGWLAALLLVLAYPLLLAAGLYVGLVWLSEAGLRRAGRADAGPGPRALALTLSLLLLLLVAAIPILGWLVVLGLLLAGTGAVKLGAWRRYLAARSAGSAS
jgi:hypothetical protein